MYVHCSGASSQAKGFRGSGVDRKPLACIDGSGENTKKDFEHFSTCIW